MATKSDFIVKSGIRVAANATISGSLSVNTAYFTNDVGIGTTAPSQKLSVAGNTLIGTESSTRLTLIGAGGPQAVREYYGAEVNPRWAIGRDFISSGQAGIGFVSVANGAFANVGVAMGTPGTSTLALYTSNGTALTERMRIDINGSLLVGLTSGTDNTPSGGQFAGPLMIGGYLSAHQTSKAVLQYFSNELSLRAYGATSGTGYITLRTGGGGNATDTESMRISANGNVGIGTTSPSYKLDVSSSLRVTSVDATAAYNAGVLISTTASATASTRNATIVIDPNGADGIGIDYSYLRMYGSGEFEINNSLSTGFMTFKTNNQERVRIDSTGRVGVATGATTLSASLTVGTNYGGTVNPQSQILAQSATNTYLTLGAPNTSDSGILFADSDDNDVGVVGYNHATNAMTFVANAQERMRITSAGNVGIGTNSPSALLDVLGYSHTGTDTNNSFFVNSNSSVVTVGAAGRTTFSTSALRFITSDGSAALERMRLDSSGRLLLGLTSAAAESAAIISGTNFSGRALTLTGSAINSGTAGQVSLTLAHFGDGSNPEVGSVIRSLEEGNNTLAGSLIFEVFGPTTRSEAMRINSSGNVGIGTNAPNGKLAVVGTIVGNNFSTQWAGSTGAATNIPLTTQGGGYSYLSVDNTSGVPNNASLIRLGNVYVGTNNKSASWIGSFYNYNYSSSLALYSGKKGDNALLPYQSALNAILEQDVISFYTGAAGTSDTTERVRISSLGFVGIGSTNPQSKLHIDGTNGTTSSQLQLTGTGVLSGYIGPSSNGLELGVDNANILFRTGVTGNLSVTTGTERMRITSAGNVGVGTTSPTENLEVNANIKAKQIYNNYQILTDGATITFDANLGAVAQITLTGTNRTITPSNLKAGALYHIIVKQDGTGNRTIGKWNNFYWENGVVPTLSTEPNAVNVVSGISDGIVIYADFKVMKEVSLSMDFINNVYETVV